MIVKLTSSGLGSRLKYRSYVSCVGISVHNLNKHVSNSVIVRHGSNSTDSSYFTNLWTSFNASAPSSSTPNPPESGLDPSTLSDIVSTISANAVSASADVVAPVLGNNPSDYVMSLIENAHLFTGLPYWQTIIGITIILRLGLLPIAIKSVLNGARMGALRPDMQKVQDAFKNDPHAEETSVKLKYQKEMQNLFVKHKVNPFLAVMMPLVQLPIFLTFYFALEKMGKFYPGLQHGGAFWFENLSAPDPYLILPVVNGLSFLIMIEIGADGMQSQENQQQMGMMKMIMRGLGFLVVPLTMTVPESVFMYWTANNMFSIVQTLIIQKTGLKKWLGIPDTPVDAPPLKIRSPLASISEAVRLAKEDRKIQLAKQADVSTSADIPPPPPTSTLEATPVTDMPTFRTNPRFAKKESAASSKQTSS